MSAGDFYGDLSPIVDNDLAAFVRDEDRHRSLTVVLEDGEVDAHSETQRWMDRKLRGPGDVEMCKAMRTVLAKHVGKDRPGQLSGAVALIWADRAGHRGIADALEELRSERDKDPRDWRRIVESGYRFVLSRPQLPPEDIGCRCDTTQEPDPMANPRGGFFTGAPTSGPQSNGAGPKPGAEGEDTSERERDSWESVDLGPYIRGEVKRLDATVGAQRTDGQRLLYPGLQHSCSGETESGKSWLALVSIREELARGNVVVYIHFEEQSPNDTVTRLLLLGVPAEALDGPARRFHFIAPESPGSIDRIERWTTPAPSLVVLDGVNEGMTLHGHKIYEPEGAAAWRRLLVRPFTAVGAAVLELDHVVKNEDSRSSAGYRFGSVHKGNAVNGAEFLLENVEPFGRGRKGRSRVFTTKDRPGDLRRHGQPTKVPRKTYIGDLVVDARDDQPFSLLLWPPMDDDTRSQLDEQRTNELDEHVAKTIGRLVRIRGEEVSTVAIAAEAKRKKADVILALERLVSAGRVLRIEGPHGAKLHALADFADDGEDGD